MTLYVVCGTDIFIFNAHRLGVIKKYGVQWRFFNGLIGPQQANDFLHFQ